jgi:hypothetical protein
MTIEHLEREFRFLKAYAVATTILFVVALVAVTTRAQSQGQRFTEIDVERINVVEPDGRLVLAIANTQRMAAPMIEGKELPRELSEGRVGSAGIIFFDPQGTEVGGLTFRTELRPDGTYAASRSLTFDQHQQDQVVGLQYSDNGKTRRQGLTVWDRPTSITLKEMIATIHGTPDRAAVEKRFAELAKERGGNITGAPRAFLGSQDRTAALRLMDTNGRERIRMLVDPSNEARMEFLDEAGKVVYSLPR